MANFDDVADAYVKGQMGLGQWVRDYIDSHNDRNDILAADISNKLEDWRTSAEEDIKDGFLDRKAVNNVAGYVSKICREKLGYTLKCTKKKPKYVYTPFEVEERKAPIPKSPAVSTGDDVDSLTSSIGPVYNPTYTASEVLEALINDKGLTLVAKEFKALIQEEKANAA